MTRSSVDRAVMDERARHVSQTDSPRLRFHRECVGKALKGRKFEGRDEVSRALSEAAKACALKNPFPKKSS